MSITSISSPQVDQFSLEEYRTFFYAHEKKRLLQAEQSKLLMDWDIKGPLGRFLFNSFSSKEEASLPSSLDSSLVASSIYRSFNAEGGENSTEALYNEKKQCYQKRISSSLLGRIVCILRSNHFLAKIISCIFRCVFPFLDNEFKEQETLFASMQTLEKQRESQINDAVEQEKKTQLDRMQAARNSKDFENLNTTITDLRTSYGMYLVLTPNSNLFALRLWNLFVASTKQKEWDTLTDITLLGRVQNNSFKIDPHWLNFFSHGDESPITRLAMGLDFPIAKGEDSRGAKFITLRVCNVRKTETKIQVFYEPTAGSGEWNRGEDISLPLEKRLLVDNVMSYKSFKFLQELFAWNQASGWPTVDKTYQLK